MKAILTKNARKPSKSDKISFVLHIVFYICAFVFFLFISIISLTTEYPTKDSLVYEECTFIKYDFISKESRNHSTTRYYNIYVKEYDEPLGIDNIIYDRVHQGYLGNLKKGDKITVSIKKDEKRPNLYVMSYDKKYILSYDDYRDGHMKNDEIGHILFPILTCMITGLFIAEFIHYKTKGKPLPWPRSVYT